MDNLLLNYIRSSMTEEQTLMLVKAHQLMMDFDPNYTELPYLNILAVSENSDPEELRLAILQQTKDDSVLITNSHGIHVTENVTLFDINLINQGLYDLQYLNDYVNIPDILLTDLSNEEKMFYVLEAVTNTDNSYFSDCIEEVDDVAIEGLVAFIDERLSLLSVGAHDQESLTDRSVKLLQKLREKSKWESLLGIEILEADVPAGFPFNLYMDYINEYFQLNTASSLDFVALNVLSVIYLTKLGIVDPIGQYNDIKDLLFADLETQNQVASKIMYLHEA